MLFPTHLLAGYLLGRWFQLPVAWVVVGAALPDVIDKPLAMLGVVDLYHTIGHSIFTLLVVGLLAWRSRLWMAIWVGWASHLALDALQMAINGRPGDVTFLLWPLVRHTPDVRLPPLEFAIYYVGTPAFFVELAIWLLAAYVVLIRGNVEFWESPLR